MDNNRSGKAKRILVVLTALILAVSLTACTVPYTYVSIAGNYIKQNREVFSELIDEMDEGVQTALDALTDDPETIGYYEDMFHLDSTGSSSAEIETAQTEETPAAPESKPEKTETDKKETAAESKNTDSKKEETESANKDAEETAASSESSQEDQTNSEKEEQESVEKSEPVESTLKSPYVPAYVHYEKSDFEELCEAFKKAGKENDTKNIQEYYDKLADFLKQICTMDSVAFINFSVNVNEKYFDDEYSYNEQLVTDCNDMFLIACKEVLESEGGETFRNYANPLVVEDAKDYEPLSDHAKELMEQETKLETKYNTELDKINDITYDLNGKTYTFGDLYDDASSLSMLAVFNYNDFITVYKGLLKNANAALGPIYLDLLAIRVELAKELGYESYADYCYEETFGRGYTTKDAQEYCDVIKKNVGKKYYQNAYYSLYNSSYFETEFTLDEIFSIMDKFTSGFDSLINDSLKELKEKELYDIGSGDGRYAGSYTTSLYSEHVPFIFINGEFTIDALSTLEHEFGHFTNDLYEESKDEDYVFVSGNYDVFEIHSNAMQLLCSNHYNEIVGETEAREAQEYELSVQLSSVIEGCIYDEFQRNVYENPDITLNELNSLFGKINDEYGANALPGNEYMWVLVNHNFESPMYYISYSISALSAMEIWTISQKSEEKAVKTWLKVMKESDDEDYETVMKNAGLTPFTDSSGVVAICKKVLNQF